MGLKELLISGIFGLSMFSYSNNAYGKIILDDINNGINSMYKADIKEIFDSFKIIISYDEDMMGPFLPDDSV